jgi:hypothetical protein
MSENKSQSNDTTYNFKGDTQTKTQQDNKSFGGFSFFTRKKVENEDLKEKNFGKKSYKKWLLISFSLIIIIGLGFGSFWLYLTLNSSKFTLFRESGKVFYKRSYDLSFQELQDKFIELPSLTSIRTQNGFGHLKLQNEAIVSLSQNAEIFIDTNPTSTQIRLRFGNIWNRLKPLAKNESFEVETATSLATVRGTIFDVGFYPSENYASTAVVENRVSVKKRNANGEYIEASEKTVEENKLAIAGEGVGDGGISIEEFSDKIFKTDWYARNVIIDKEYRQNNETDLTKLTEKNDGLKKFVKEVENKQNPTFESVVREIRKEIKTESGKNLSSKKESKEEQSSNSNSSDFGSVSSKNISSTPSRANSFDISDFGKQIGDFSNFNAELFAKETCKDYPPEFLTEIKAQLLTLPNSLFEESGLNKSEIISAIDQIKSICYENESVKKKLIPNQSASSQRNTTNKTKSEQELSSSTEFSSNVSENYEDDSSLEISQKLSASNDSDEGVEERGDFEDLYNQKLEVDK